MYSTRLGLSSELLH